MADKYIPNSFQLPNVFVDELLPYLTGNEVRVLLYALRRTLGFNKRQDRIALAQFTDGLTSQNGEKLDNGTGLSRPEVSEALKGLISYRVLVTMGSNQNGTLYGVPIEDMNIDYSGLQERLEQRKKTAGKRIAAAQAANKTKRAKRKDPQQQPVNQVVCGTYQGEQYVPRTAGGTSHVPQVVRPTYPQNTVETQRNTDILPDEKTEPEHYPTPEELGFSRPAQAQPAKYRTAADVRAGAAAAMQRGVVTEYDLQQKIYRLFRLSPNWAIKTNRDFLRWLKELPEDQTLDEFARWWYVNDWRGKKGQDPELKWIRESWPKAFIKRVSPAINADQQWTTEQQAHFTEWSDDLFAKLDLAGMRDKYLAYEMTTIEAKSIGVYELIDKIDQLSYLDCNGIPPFLR